ncbi:hypothetical protein FPQ18DRAFT_402124 [Pyronema domesticum]|uniref:Azaphilone pigments biosynthesis cluster protein L N-terminal domain-containing protein n=1 Tax=Pyronema omphalodes (strain CBS 100304) TaxID=1076935 RepID=U4L6Y3_PYROM|nr:hypothetical protein FPQ18DRAFT_402124 [Pyronema domesticum]CCX12874.1 Similar to conserved hypothetical protein [Arthroderma otae CBS 113480]; acc. no. XP_002847693 [Pyronema omphalodes CBS 100304]
MDPFTISAGLSGFLSLALGITKILSIYISDIKPAPSDAKNLLLEVTALCHDLDQLVKFLRTDVKGDFAQTSALYVAIMTCQKHIEDLYKKLKKLQYRNDKNKVKGIAKRVVEWPIRKDDYQSTLGMIQRFVGSFRVSLMVGNCELLFKSSAEVISSLEENRKQ